PAEHPGSSTNMHETPRKHPPHIHETTPRTTRKHVLSGNERNGKGEHIEPSSPTRILQPDLKGTAARAPHHPHHTPTTAQYGHQAHKPPQATLTPTPPRPSQGKEGVTQKVTPPGQGQSQGARGGNSFMVVKLFHGGETVSWW